MSYFTPYKEHYKALIRLGIPIVIGQIGIVVVGLADNMMVGQYATLDLAAASFVNSAFNIPILFGLGFSYGLTPLVGQFFGRHDKYHVGQLLRNSLLVNLFIGLLLTLAMTVVWFNIDRLGQPEELLPLIRPYFLLQLASLVFVMLFNSFKQFADGITDTKTPMYIMISANLVNIAGNYILIYGKFGLPALGVVGAGISTLTARILMFVAFAVLFYRNLRYRRYLVGYKRGKYNFTDILSLNKMGWMVGLQMGLETALFSITGIMIGWLGSIALAAHQVMVAISTLGFMIYYGVGAAVSVRVSNYFGRQELLHVRRTTMAGFTHSLSRCLCLYCVLIFPGTDRISIHHLRRSHPGRIHPGLYPAGLPIRGCPSDYLCQFPPRYRRCDLHGCHLFYRLLPDRHARMLHLRLCTRVGYHRNLDRLSDRAYPDRSHALRKVLLETKN